jgi:hypothetical protein
VKFNYFKGKKMRLLFLVLFSMTLTLGFSQITEEQIPNLEGPYVSIVQFGNAKRAKFRISTEIGTDYQNIKLSQKIYGMAQVLNLMDKYGWEYVDNLTYSFSYEGINSLVTEYCFRKREEKED